MRQPSTHLPRHPTSTTSHCATRSYKSEDAFLKNLRVRFENDVIYTYIRGVCISVNPYQVPANTLAPLRLTLASRTSTFG